MQATTIVAEQQYMDTGAAKERLRATPSQLWEQCQHMQPGSGTEQAQALSLAAAAAQQLQGAEDQQQLRQWLPEASAAVLEARADQDPQQLMSILEQVLLYAGNIMQSAIACSGICRQQSSCMWTCHGALLP